ncbi:hypothetical protein JHW45_01390 [Paracoccus stylophorae]|uniref:Uncharacterized protein n=1 Tax=Paracoccus stylophorae TaxID=659350 RepID=A0ABY7SX82_9RHOB|nr:hypothetical protein [Paracoccus stylophorae]WCR11093.1 hypothetical protein JHW45_01390 [Paracoccus stylophorae]
MGDLHDGESPNARSKTSRATISICPVVASPSDKTPNRSVAVETEKAVQCEVVAVAARQRFFGRLLDPADRLRRGQHGLQLLGSQTLTVFIALCTVNTLNMAPTARHLDLLLFAVET